MPFHDNGLLFLTTSLVIQIYDLELACVASVSVRFRRKERGTRVKDRAKNTVSERAGRGWGRKSALCKQFPSPPPPPSFTFWLSFHFSRGQNGKSPSSVFLCSETKRKRLLRRLPGTRFSLRATPSFCFKMF